MVYNAIDISKILISMAQEDNSRGGELLTNLKLQKLLYYQQGYHLAQFGKPLFFNKIEAWKYGPVVPEVYDYYNKYGANSLPLEKSEITFGYQQNRLFNLVYKYYNNYSAIGLMNLTHEESPWIESLPHSRGTLIFEDCIKNYFDKQILVFLKEIHRKKLSSLKSLRKGWDGYDAPEINLESIDRSIALLDLVNVNALAILKVEPSEEGGVNLFFEKDENSTMGCSVGDNRMSYFIKYEGKAPVFSDFLEYSDKNLIFWKNQVNQFAEDE